MIKRTLIAGLVIFSLLVVSMNFALAAYSETMTDEPGDVLDYYTEEGADDKDNIDIKELTCSRDYRRVAFTLKVYGDIENIGDIHLWRLWYDTDYQMEILEGLSDEEATALIEEMLTSMDIAVSYTFIIETPSNEYIAFYVNQEILIIDGSGKIIDGTFSSSGDTLSITFNLLTSSERLENVSVLTQEDDLSSEEGSSYSDDIIIAAYLNDTAPVGGDDSGDDEEESDSGLTVFILMIIIIIIAVIAIVVYFVRR